jgi:ceramide glucosyltransferase
MTSFGLALVLILGWAYLIGSTVAALRFARRPILAAAERFPVSVLKPLHGDEPALYENLRSFVDQDYTPMQVVFGVRHPGDGALPAVRALIRDRPGCDLALVNDQRARGSNLKVANLENMLPTARHDILVIADSDMRVERYYLDAVTAPLADPRVGLVTCLYKGVPTGGLWSSLGAMHINHAFLPSALLGDMLRVGGGCFGATIALRRSVLERVGGFALIRDELADDHRLGAAVRQLGLGVALSPYLVENDVTELSFVSLWHHELRWARTVRTMAPAGFAASIVSHSVMLAVLAALAAMPSAVGWYFVALTLGLRWASAALIARSLALPTAGLWLLPLRDVLSFAVFAGSFCGRSVLWRDQLFQVEPGGRMTVEGDKPV